jgi:ferredoxin
MACQITDRCSGCGQCLTVCPVSAIFAAPPVYWIDPWLCVECLGFSEEPQCAVVCPDAAIDQPAATAP